MKFLPVIVVLLSFFIAVCPSWAATDLLPHGTIVSATVDKTAATAHVNISGTAPVAVEFYGYKGVKKLGAVSNFDVCLREGRRFNFSFKAADGKTHFALLTPEMAAYPPEFFGEGVGMDCSNPDGCCFLITGK
ncbi:hypothetical protein J7J13_02690 [bacterium]|nr:hypothetical protein [bacterium]